MNKKAGKIIKIFSIIVFIIYVILLIWVIMLKCNLVDSITKTYEYLKTQNLEQRFKLFLKPFNDYYEGPFVSQWRNTLKDDILNIIIFIPLGMYLGYFFKNKRFLKSALIVFGVSLFFELFQLFSLLGSFATKDLITNTIGGIIGSLLSILIYRKNNSTIKLIIFNVLSIIVISIFIPIVLFAIVNTLKHLDVYLNIIIRNL